MKKAILSFFGFLLLFFVTACAGGVDGQLDKLEKMIEKQNELAKDEGYKAKETVLNFQKLVQLGQQLETESQAENSDWTEEQKARLSQLADAPILGKASTLEEVRKQNDY